MSEHRATIDWRRGDDVGQNVAAGQDFPAFQLISELIATCWKTLEKFLEDNELVFIPDHIFIFINQ